MNVTLEANGALSPMNLSLPRAEGVVIGFWIVTALFCLQIGFTAYAQLRLPHRSVSCQVTSRASVQRLR